MKKKELLKIIKSIENPYPEGVFPDPEFNKWFEIRELCDKNGLSMDSFFGTARREAFDLFKTLLIDRIQNHD